MDLPAALVAHQGLGGDQRSQDFLDEER